MPLPHVGCLHFSISPRNPHFSNFFFFFQTPLGVPPGRRSRISIRESAHKTLLYAWWKFKKNRISRLDDTRPQSWPKTPLITNQNSKIQTKHNNWNVEIKSRLEDPPGLLPRVTIRQNVHQELLYRLSEWNFSTESLVLEIREPKLVQNINLGKISKKVQSPEKIQLEYANWISPGGSPRTATPAHHTAKCSPRTPLSIIRMKFFHRIASFGDTWPQTWLHTRFWSNLKILQSPEKIQLKYGIWISPGGKSAQPISGYYTAKCSPETPLSII